MSTLWERIGGSETFETLIANFYAGVSTDPLLRPMYPDEDLRDAAERLQLFLEQYWGGPHTYQETRGHPRLRMRHAEFRITPAARDAWLFHMLTAVDQLDLDDDNKKELVEYLTLAANSLVNTLEQD